jgi:hypothetical protein
MQLRKQDMRRSQVLTLAFATGWAVATVAVAAPPDPVAAPRQAVAFCDFTTTTFSYRDATDAQKLSDLVQAELASDDSEDAFTWVERSEIDAARRELEVMALGGVDSTASLRVGQWLKADYLVKGRLALRDRNTRRLSVEVIDLDHADVVATRTVDIPTESGGRLDLSGPRLERMLAAVRAALQEAQPTRAASQRQVLVAPLFFRNAETTSRLDFFADDLAGGFQRRNRAQQRVRYLQFPRARDAIDEADLMASGLVASTGDWQNLADYYVWGLYRELNGNGREFADVDAEVMLEVWDGRGEVRHFTERAQVKDLRGLIERVVARVEGAARTKNMEPVVEDLRARVASEIGAVAAEVQEWVVQTDTGDFSRPAEEWLRLWGQCVRMLSVAAFFDPTNERLRRELLIETTRDDVDFMTLPGNQEFWRLWRRSNAWKVHCEQFGYDYEHDHAPVLKTRGLLGDNRLDSSSALLQYINAAVDVLRAANERQGPAEGGPPDDAPADVLEQWRAELAREYVDRVQFAAKTSPDRVQRMAKQMLRLCLWVVRDDELRAAAIQSLWPLVLKDSSFRADEDARGMNEVFARLGRPEVAAALLAEAVQRGRTTETSSTPLPVAASHSVNPATEPTAPAVAPTTTVPMRTISLDKHFYIQRVTALQFAGERLWIGLEGQFRTLRQGYALFTCSTDGSDIRIYPNINPRETHITDMMLDDGALWLATDGDGVCRLDLRTDALHKFAARDGLPSPKVFALTRSGGMLYAGGGAEDRGMLASLAEGADSWTQQELPPITLRTRIFPTAHVMQLAADGQWLAAYSHIGGSLTQLLVRKATGGPWTDAGVVLRDAHPEFSSFRDWRLCVSDLMFVGDELWILTERGLAAYDPSGNRVTFAAAMPYELTAGMHRGDRLWIAAKPATPGESRVPADAQSYLLAFNLKTRQWERQIELPNRGTVTAMTFQDDRLWLALGGKGATVGVVEAESLP